MNTGRSAEGAIEALTRKPVELAFGDESHRVTAWPRASHRKR
jgi:hypothetical protein